MFGGKGENSYDISWLSVNLRNRYAYLGIFSHQKGCNIYAPWGKIIRSESTQQIGFPLYAAKCQDGQFSRI